MQVSIEVKETHVAPFRDEVQTYTTLFGRTKEQAVRIPQKEQHTWDVHLTLIPTEEERAIILKFKMENNIVDEEPYKPGEFDAIFLKKKAEYGGTDAAANRAAEYVMTLQGTKKPILLHEYFNNPYIKEFNTPREAHDYIDSLKEKILPLIKSNIDHYGGRTEKESFTL